MACRWTRCSGFARPSPDCAAMSATGARTTAGGWLALRQYLGAASQSSPNVPLPPDLSAHAADRELLVRWFQALCLLPAYEPPAHTALNPLTDLLVRLCRQLRERFAPYLYSAHALHRDYGWSVLRSADATFNPPDRDTLLIGDALLVAPVTEAGALTRDVRLPDGRWYDYWNDRLLDGGQSVNVSAPLERLPLFVRAGVVLPLRSPAGAALGLRAYVGDGESTVYEDGGSATDYADGNFRWVYMTSHAQAGQVRLARRMAGRYQPPYNSLTLEVVGLPGPPSSVQVDRRSAPIWHYEGGRLELSVPDDFSEVDIDTRD